MCAPCSETSVEFFFYFTQKKKKKKNTTSALFHFDIEWSAIIHQKLVLFFFLCMCLCVLQNSDTNTSRFFSLIALRTYSDYFFIYFIFSFSSLLKSTSRTASLVRFRHRPNGRKASLPLHSHQHS